MRKVALVLVSLFMGGCGVSPGKIARPPSSSAMQTLGEASPAVSCDRGAKPKYLEPLVVDWRSSERADLEVAMRQGVVPVRHECGVVRLVKSCRISGSYEFAGVSRKSEVIQLTNEDELKANLPLSSVQLAAQVQSGATVDLALLLVGKRTTSVADVERSELEGSCEDVTHFVRAAHVGAFAFTTGEMGHVSAAADIFKIANSGMDSQSKRKAVHRDGSIDACDKSTPEAERPPAECGSPLRVELVPILDHRAYAEVASPKSAQTADDASDPAKPAEGDAKKGHGTKAGPAASHAIHNPCEQGFVYSGGKCARSASSVHLCEPSDYEGCELQCSKGSAKSCYHLARLLRQGSWEAKPDPKRATELFQAACTAEVPEACSEAIDLTSATSEKERQELLPKHDEWLEKGCNAGGSASCYALAYRLTSRDSAAAEPVSATVAERAFRLAERACTLDGSLCSPAASFLLDGIPKRRDVGRASKMLEKACFGQEISWSCNQFGSLNAIRKNLIEPKKAIDAFLKGCDLGDPNACASLGRAYRTGDLVAKNASKALLYLERSCTRWGGGGGCFELAEMYERGEGTGKALSFALELYLRQCRSRTSPDAAQACHRYLALTPTVERSHRDDDDAVANVAACGSQTEPDLRACKWVEAHVMPRCQQGHGPSCALVVDARNTRHDIHMIALEKSCGARSIMACTQWFQALRAQGKKEEATRAEKKTCDSGIGAYFCSGRDLSLKNLTAADLEKACKRSAASCPDARARLVDSKASAADLRKFDEVACETWPRSRDACKPLFDALVASHRRDETARASQIARGMLNFIDAEMIAKLEKADSGLARPLWGELCRRAVNGYWYEPQDRAFCQGYERSLGDVSALKGRKTPLFVDPQK